MLKRGSLLTLLATGACAAFTAVAWATAPVTHPFGNGAWVSGAGQTGTFGLVTSSDSSGSYGGATIQNFPSDPTAVKKLSFDYMANESGASGGSPRLVVQFSDDGNATLRPLSFTAGMWNTVDGSSDSNWDNAGGTCGFAYAATWNGVVACHPDATITGMWIVNDSGWLYPGTGLTVTLDNITVNDLVTSGPGNAK